MRITHTYTVAGEYRGMRLIIEHGLCTDKGSTINELRKYETGRLLLVGVPRRKGLIAKVLDGRSVRTYSISDPAVGDIPHCVQVGRTEFRQVAPRQPVGPLRNHRILAYTRRWVQLEES